MIARRSWVRTLVVLALGSLLLGRWIAVAVAQRLWARSLDVQAGHAAIADLKLTLLALAFALAAVWSLGNLYLVYRTIGSVHVPRRLGNLEIVEAVPRRYLLYGTVGLGLVIAILVSYRASGWWYALALVGGRTPVELRDPILHRDLAYYLFRLPWERTLHDYLATLSGLLLVMIGGLYGFVGAIRVTNRKLVVADWARTHLAGLLVVFAAILATGFRLDPAEYVAGLRNVPYDTVMLNVRLPVSRLLAGVAVAVALASLAWVWVDRAALVVVPWATLALLALLGVYVMPGFSAARRGPSELAVPELVAAQRNLLSIAFAVPQSDTTVDPPAGPAASLLASGGAELALVPLWDEATLTDALNRTATAGPYEHFAGVGLNVYPGRDGRPVPVFVGAREVDLLAAREADSALSWSNVHAGAYSRARGAVALPAARASANGLPLFASSLARPDSATPQPVDLDLPAPDLLYTPAAEDYAVVERRPRQVGIAPGGLGRRLALAWTLQSPRLLSREAAPPSAVVLWHRAVAGRLDRYAPFARFGAPHPVVAGDRLVWLSWGYVSAEAFPLSVAVPWRRAAVRYLRASLVGVVDAASGETAVYLRDDPDPLSAAWAALLPDIVRPASRLPEALKRHVRYPDELFAAQILLSASPPPDPLPVVRVAAAAAAPRPVWLVGTLPGDDVTRLRLRAVVEHGDPGMLAAVVDGHVEGTKALLRVVRFAQPLAHAGPSPFAARIANELDAGTRAAGPVTTLVRPDGVVMLRSVFTRPASDEGAPRLQEVVAGAGSAVGRGPVPAAALLDLVLAARLTSGTPADWSEAQQWFRRLDAARRTGDWAAFGRAYERLRRLLGVPSDSAP